ncbi:hypothetical protein GCM10011490_19600 [Pseudoclavibacter endophyticus]|uniref:Uncharacterized protein n=1 Tax=Pseudoclavibacter endophyticus TaxID=1778590 RepID=A0A6H9WG91_9MICO|nr:hypothetical protein [Pseudoclavibacter endophyticus]KAB1648024.1 hypothetical protein F8O04_09825 [Pseudoclavibacter endophyticus]GGA69120.1 hypothetical protein GCM10011490_19600 [Pseudoclavibacter endophyticus]
MRWILAALALWIGTCVLLGADVDGVAASTGTAASANPLLDGLDATDAEGIPLVSYQHLPLDRGSALDSHATMTSWLTDAAWTGHVGVIALSLQLLEWVLGFAWLEWVLGPLDALRRSLADLLGGVAWAPFALLVAALVGGIVAFRGRLGAGVTQLAVSATCFALSTTVMLAPLTAITGSDDPVGDARTAGEAIASMVVDDVLTEAGGEHPRDERPGIGEEAAVGDPETAMTLLRTHIVTLFVRGAAQEVAFGGRLDGTPCQQAFTESMGEEAPAPGNSGVRDAVAECSEKAAAYADEPSLWQPFAVVVTMSGSSALLGFVAVLSIALLGAVLACVVAGIRAMVWINLAILPGIGRRRFARAVADAATSLIAVVVLIVAVAAASAFIVAVARQAADAGTSLTMQMAWVTGVLIAAAVALASIGRRLRAGGRSAAASLRSFVRGDIGVPARPTPVIVRLGDRGAVAAPTTSGSGRSAVTTSGAIP